MSYNGINKISRDELVDLISLVVQPGVKQTFLEFLEAFLLVKITMLVIDRRKLIEELCIEKEVASQKQNFEGFFVGHRIVDLVFLNQCIELEHWLVDIKPRLKEIVAAIIASTPNQPRYLLPSAHPTHKEFQDGQGGWSINALYESYEQKLVRRHGGISFGLTSSVGWCEDSMVNLFCGIRFSGPLCKRMSLLRLIRNKILNINSNRIIIALLGVCDPVSRFRFGITAKSYETEYIPFVENLIEEIRNYWPNCKLMIRLPKLRSTFDWERFANEKKIALSEREHFPSLLSDCAGVICTYGITVPIDCYSYRTPFVVISEPSWFDILTCEQKSKFSQVYFEPNKSVSHVIPKMLLCLTSKSSQVADQRYQLVSLLKGKS